MGEPGNEEAVSSHKRRLMQSLERRREIAAVTAKEMVVVRAGPGRFSVATDSRLNSGIGRPVEDLKLIFGGRLLSGWSMSCRTDRSSIAIAATMTVLRWLPKPLGTGPAQMRYGNTFVCYGLAALSSTSTATSKSIVWT